MLSIRLHLLRNSNNRLMQVSSSHNTSLRLVKRQHHLRTLMCRQQDTRRCSTMSTSSQTVHTGGSPRLVTKPQVRRVIPMWSRHRTTSSQRLMQKVMAECCYWRTSTCPFKINVCFSLLQIFLQHNCVICFTVTNKFIMYCPRGTRIEMENCLFFCRLY